MNEKLVIHAGLHKTGTSFLQKSLYHNIELLRSSGWDFLCVDRSGNSSSLVNVTKEKKIVSKVSDSFESVLSKCDFSNAIISAEYLSFLTDEDEVYKLRNISLRYFKEVLVVFFLRRQDELAVSFKQQSAKSPSYNLMPSSMLMQHGPTPLPEVTEDVDEYFNYYNKISLWTSVFGNKKVIFDLYDKSCKGDKYLENFLFFCGIKVDYKRLITPQNLVNPGLSRRESLIYHCLLALDVAKNDCDFSKVDISDNKPVKPSISEAKSFMKRFQDSNKLLFESYSCSKKFDEDFSSYPIESDYFLSNEERAAVKFLISNNKKNESDVELFNYLRDYLYERSVVGDLSALELFSKLKIYRGHGKKITELYKKVFFILSENNNLSIEHRIAYYLGCFSNKNINLFDNEFKRDEVFLFDVEDPVDTAGSYKKDALNFFKNKKNNQRYYPICFGDKVHYYNSFFFCKARDVDKKLGCIIRLNKQRHWENYNVDDQIDIHEKLNDIVWRGATTGYGSESGNDRYLFVSKYYEKHNVGFSKLVQGRSWSGLIKGPLTKEQQLAYKYIVVLEGNDVATSLKWVLLSNSVPIMKAPTKETWLMEGLLVPYVHYLPLNDDMTNVNELLKWGEDNPLKLKEIANNGKLFMSIFNDETIEEEIEKRILSKYLNGTI